MAKTVADSIVNLTATELAREIAAGRLTSTEVVETHIKRIEDVDPHLNAMVVRLFDKARQDAGDADQAVRDQARLGPLHGVPLTIKEQFMVAGTDTNLGVPANQGKVAVSEGPLVTRLRQAGAVILGKTNVMMALAGWESDNPVYGRTANPFDTTRTAGGSSGGEAAILAARGSPLGLGGDFGGSIRIPCHFNGLHGLKPTGGRLTNADTPAAFFSSGQNVIIPQPGPMARSVDDLDLAMTVLAAPPPDSAPEFPPPVPWPDYRKLTVAGMKVAMCVNNGLMPASPALMRAVNEAAEVLRSQGAIVADFTPPSYADMFSCFFQINAAGKSESIPRTLAGDKSNHLLRDFARSVSTPVPILKLIAWIMSRTAQQRMADVIRNMAVKDSSAVYWQLVEHLHHCRIAFTTELQSRGFDAIICPPFATVAPQHGETVGLTPVAGSYSIVHNATGLPAGVVAITRVKEDEELHPARNPHQEKSDQTALSVEQSSAGMPVGVQVVGHYWREDVVLRIMKTLEDHFQHDALYPLNSIPDFG